MIVYHYIDKPVFLRFFCHILFLMLFLFLFFFSLKELRVPKVTDIGRMVQIYTNFNLNF